MEEDSESGSDAAMEVDEVNEENEDSASEGEGDDTANVPVVARAVNGRTKGSRGRNERVMAPEEVRAHLRWLFRNEASICSLMFGRQGPFAPINAQGFSPSTANMFFLDVVAISPTRFRPPARMDDKLLEHPHNVHLTKVLSISYALRDITNSLRAASSKDGADTPIDRDKLLGQLFERLIMLQSEVNSFMDSSKNPNPVRQGKLPVPGVKQGLEKKEGLFRMHMMV
jgi:DNA-directed RNA polymerase I subunit RPA1